MSSATFGHTGYTGTSIWIDPEQRLFVIVLTNRVFAPRTGSSITKLKRIRGRLADAAVRLWREKCASGDLEPSEC
jgi:CubicO group peptidase (beta-lactamase class C family)